MSPNTPQFSESTPEPSPWSREAHEAKLEASRPTADNPAMFGPEDVLVNARFSGIPGEILSGLITGYYYEGDTKINIVELSQKSRDLRAAEGFDSPTMVVQESLIAPMRSAETSKQIEVKAEARIQAEKEVGTIAIEASTFGPDMDAEGRSSLSNEDIRAYFKRMSVEREAEESTAAHRTNTETVANIPSETRSEVKPSTLEDEIATLPVDAQRAVKDYELYMNAADRSVQANGHNKDADEDRQHANRIISGLPTATQDLARRYYKAKYTS